MAIYDLKVLTGIIENERARSKQYIQDAKERKKQSKAIETQMNLAKMQIDANMEKLNMQIEENRLLNEDSKKENRYLKELEIIANEIASDQSILLDTKNKLNTKITESSENLLAYNSIPEESKSFMGEELKTNTDDFRTNLINREKNQQARLEYQQQLLNELNSVISKTVDFKNAFSSVNVGEDGTVKKSDLENVGINWLNENIPNYDLQNPKHDLWTTIYKNQTSDLTLMNINSQLEELKKAGILNKYNTIKGDAFNLTDTSDVLKNTNTIATIKAKTTDEWKSQGGPKDIIQGQVDKLDKGDHVELNEFLENYDKNAEILKGYDKEGFEEALKKQAQDFYTNILSLDDLYANIVNNEYNLLESVTPQGEKFGELLFKKAYSSILTDLNNLNNIGLITAPNINVSNDNTDEIDIEYFIKGKGFN
jgi:hypothetical protein